MHLRRPGLRRPSALLVTALLGALLAPAPAHAGSQEVVVQPTASTIVVSGLGYGHGHGMSQYGAKGAAERGLSHRQILAHYYPGTGWGSAGGVVKVLITADTTRDVVVSARRGLTARSLARKASWNLSGLRPRATRWRLRPVAGGRTQLASKQRGRWRTVRTFAGDAEFGAAGRPVTLHLPSGPAAYRGRLRATHGDTVNVVPLEGYLKGVVPREMPALWHPEAVRAQAVAARSYAAHERATTNRGHFDVYDTVASQVYGGVGSEHPAATAAIGATARQVLTYRGAPAFTQFSSSNGGWMLENSSVPYLVSKEDEYDPEFRWSKAIPISAFQARWPTAGTIRRLVVTTYPAAGGWVDTVRIEGDRTYTITGAAFRSWAGLRSSHFTLAAR